MITSESYVVMRHSIDQRQVFEVAVHSSEPVALPIVKDQTFTYFDALKFLLGCTGGIPKNKYLEDMSIGYKNKKKSIGLVFILTSDAVFNTALFGGLVRRSQFTRTDVRIMRNDAPLANTSSSKSCSLKPDLFPHHIV